MVRTLIKVDLINSIQDELRDAILSSPIVEIEKASGVSADRLLSMASGGDCTLEEAKRVLTKYHRSYMMPDYLFRDQFANSPND